MKNMKDFEIIYAFSIDILQITRIIKGMKAKAL